MLSEAASKQLLVPFGVPFAQERVCSTVDQAVEGVLSVYQKGVALNIDSKNLGFLNPFRLFTLVVADNMLEFGMSKRLKFLDVAF